MSTTSVTVRLPELLIKKADIAAEIGKKNRAEIVKEALRSYLEEIENDETFKEAVVERYLDGRIEFEVLKEFVGKRDAESIRVSKTVLDQGEELAGEFTKE